MPWMNFIILAFSLAGLWLGSNVVVNNATKVARHFGLSEFFIGLTIISIGTDLPEMVVSITASIHKLKGDDVSGLIIGNALGSCLTQIGFALGLAGLFQVLTVGRSQALRDGITMGIATFILMVLASDGFISRIEGVLLVVIFIFYVSILLSQEKAQAKTQIREPRTFRELTKIYLLLLAGLGVVIYSSDWTVRTALGIANYYNISQAIIGIFIIGLGTSLPEIAVAISGISRGSTGITGGTVIGSTIFDILVPIGISASISTLSFDIQIANFDIPAFLIIGLIVFAFFLTKKGISKVEAVIILALYFLYAWLKLIEFS